MTASPRRFRSLIAASALAFAACSDGGTGPDGDRAFDPARVEAGIRSMEDLAGQPVLESFRTLADHVGAAGGLDPALSGSLPGATRLAQAVARIAGVTAAPGAALVPIIRTSVLGTTFVYDPAQSKYVADPARSGAPPNGIRFILYESENGHPVPSKEVGYADLTDERVSAANSLGLRLTVVGGDVTYLDYRFELGGSIGSAELDVDGFLSDGTERVDFELTTTGQLFGRGGTVTLDAKLGVPGHDFEVEVTLVGEAGVENGDGELGLVVRSGADRIDVEAVVADGQIDATFTVNGTLLARAAGDAQHPVITGEGGRELTDEEMHALAGIVSFAGGVFAILAGLLAPAGALLVIALGI
jgi:hypothetical protein